MPLKYCVLTCMLLCFSLSHAQEKVVLTPDLIELLGELDDEDQATLDVAMRDVENKSASTKSKVSQPAKPQTSTEAGVKK